MKATAVSTQAQCIREQTFVTLRLPKLGKRGCRRRGCAAPKAWVSSSSYIILWSRKP